MLDSTRMYLTRVLIWRPPPELELLPMDQFIFKGLTVQIGQSRLHTEDLVCVHMEAPATDLSGTSNMRPLSLNIRMILYICLYAQGPKTKYLIN